jgi:hypothetical protein
LPPDAAFKTYLSMKYGWSLCMCHIRSEHLRDH